MAPPTAPTPCFGVAACSGDIADPTAAEAAMLGLSPREYDVLLLLARGHPFKSIGRLLRMSVPTVKTHAHAVYKRLEVHGKEAAIYKARQQGARLVWGEGEAARAGVAPLSLARAEAPAMRQIELPI